MYKSKNDHGKQSSGGCAYPENRWSYRHIYHPSLTADNDKVSTARDALSLQDAVNQAASNGTPVTIEKDIRLDSPVTIAAGQRVEITAETNCNIFGNKNNNLTNLFVVEEGGELSLTGALTLGGWNNTGSILVNHGKTTIDGDVVIEKSTLEGDNMGVIEDNGSSAELILENGTIQNHKIRGARGASIRVTEGASFTMNEGTIQDNIANTSSSDSSSPRSTAAGCKHVYHEWRLHLQQQRPMWNSCLPYGFQQCRKSPFYDE